VALVVGAAAAAGVVPPQAMTPVGALALLGVVGSVVVASSRPELEVFGPVLVRARHPGRLALTFDDGPHPVSTPRILEALASHGATATFFVLADRCQAHPELVRAMLAGGHEVALHGRRHDPWLTTRSPARGAAEIREALEILATLGARARRFRPPFGAVSPRLFEAARLAGVEVTWCSVRTRDGGRVTEEELKARCARAVATDIVMLHEGDRPACRCLGEILAEWQSRAIVPSSLERAMEPE
jgi:peptidoglycan/xylan/chitin deacetylase (PgdA/CDA1 family)